LAAQYQPDLALVDISLPDTTGWRVAQQLRTLPELARLKILMVSANAHEYNPGGIEGQPHDGFVMKPMDVQVLLENIGNVLGLKWRYETTPAATSESGLPETLPDHVRHHIDDLYQLGKIGHVRGIQAKLREIEAEDPDNRVFTGRLRTLVANFDLKRYMTVLEAMRNHG
jgi:CheY-like chemotaxis protein